MTARLFKVSLVSAVVLVALGAGAWYVFDAPKETPAMPGSISGTVTFPSEGIPAQRVCAVSVDGKDADAVCVETEDLPTTAATFSIRKLSPGDYYVYAQLLDPSAIGSDISTSFKAYYNEFVRCGMKYECKDTTRTVVSVRAGEDTPDIKPYDWYH